MIKFFSKSVVLVIVCLYSFTTAQAHSPNNSAVSIFKRGDVWMMKISFSTDGVLKAMRIHYQDQSLVFENSDDFNSKLNRYIKNHLNITSNKHDVIGFCNYVSVLDHHAIEVMYDLDNVSKLPVYWDMKLAICRELSGHKTMLLIKDNGLKSNFLIDDAKTSLVLIKDEEGHFKKVIKG